MRSSWEKEDATFQSEENSGVMQSSAAVLSSPSAAAAATAAAPQVSAPDSGVMTFPDYEVRIIPHSNKVKRISMRSLVLLLTVGVILGILAATDVIGKDRRNPENEAPRQNPEGLDPTLNDEDAPNDDDDKDSYYSGFESGKLPEGWYLTGASATMRVDSEHVFQGDYALTVEASTLEEELWEDDLVEYGVAVDLEHPVVRKNHSYWITASMIAPDLDRTATTLCRLSVTEQDDTVVILAEELVEADDWTEIGSRYEAASNLLTVTFSCLEGNRFHLDAVSVTKDN